MRSIRTVALTWAMIQLALPMSARAQSSADKLSFYGFLNQGIGVSGEKPVLGLNKDVSGDYRAAALQARYALSPIDNFVVQAGSRSMGTSPFSSAPGTVMLDWAFYHHRFEHAALRIGRVPVPFGLMAETRDVGTLLPFYRAPANYYLESFRSLDGVTATNDVRVAGGRLETIAYAGGTNGSIVTWLPTTVVTTKLRFERLIGGDVTYATPIDGIKLRGGIASLRSLDTAQVQAAPATKLAVLSGGFDATFDRFFARGESRRIKIGSNSRQYSYYAQTGVRVIHTLRINAQGDFLSEGANTPIGYVDHLSSADRGVSATYEFAPNVVGKMEQHWVHGGIDRFVAPGSETPYASYSLASLAVTF